MPLGAGHIAQQGGSFEPQRQNNFDLEIYDLGGNDMEEINLAIINAALPNESSDELEITYGNTKVYLAGPTTVDTIPLVVRDYVDTRVRQALIDWRKKVRDGESIGLAADYKKEARIVIYAPDGSRSRTCRLIGCWPQALNAGTIDHTGGDPMQIEATIRFDDFDWE